MSHPVKVLSAATFVAPLGLRFWDPVGRALIDGLEVIVAPADHPTRQVGAQPNRAGIYVAHHLPGLREAELGAGDEVYWQNPPTGGMFSVLVRDPAERFLAVSFAIYAPHRGVLGSPYPTLSPLSPLNATGAIALFSAPTRAVSAGAAVLRAQLYDPLRGEPAAWAIVAAKLNGSLLGLGMANRQGALALMFPYPRPPLSGQRPPLRDQTWPVQLVAKYRSGQPVAETPDLSAALAQPPAELWADEGRAAALTGVTLRYGQGLILRTTGPGGAGLPQLYITSR